MIRVRPGFARAAAPALLLSLCAGCANTTKIFVKSTEQTNGGSTLYVVLRNVDAKVAASDRYQDIVAKVFVDPPDATLVASQPIFPGNTITLTVKEGEVKDLDVCFLFTNPGPTWRVPIHGPLPSEVYVELGENQIARVQIRKR